MVRDSNRVACTTGSETGDLAEHPMALSVHVGWRAPSSCDCVRMVLRWDEINADVSIIAARGMLNSSWTE